jgi:hypothetical protein
MRFLSWTLVVAMMVPAAVAAAQQAPGGPECAQALTPSADSVVWRIFGALDAEVPPRARVLNRLRSAARLAPFTGQGWDGFVLIIRAYRAQIEGSAIIRESLRRWPRCPLTRLALVELQVTGPRDSAFRALRKIADSSPGDAYVLAAAGRGFAEIFWFPQAADCFLRALTLDSTIVRRNSELWQAYVATAGVRTELPPFKPPSGW